jgi:hypothetical protein
MDSDPFDLDGFRLERKQPVCAPSKSKRPPRHKPGEKFLKGPIPLVWLAKAARLQGKVLHVAIALWFMAGIKRARTVPLPSLTLRILGVRRQTSYRALTALEEAGLVATVVVTH